MSVFSDAVQKIQEYAQGAIEFARRHAETLVGGIVGYLAGRAIEQIPIIGRLLAPLPSLLLGGGGALHGFKQSLDRRHIETLERNSR